MSIVRTILWVLIVVAAVFFAVTNWTPVALAFGTTEIVIKLPVLLLLTAFAGYVVAALTRRRRRVEPALPPMVATPLPSEAQPTIVPPGCG